MLPVPIPAYTFTPSDGFPHAQSDCRLLRGVSLLGIDSVMAPRAAREEAWRRLALDLDPGMTVIEPMSKLPELAGKILAGKIRGRTVIDVNA